MSERGKDTVLFKRIINVDINRLLVEGRRGKTKGDVNQKVTTMQTRNYSVLRAIS